jgi:hypothetical protein
MSQGKKSIIIIVSLPLGASIYLDVTRKLAWSLVYKKRRLDPLKR